MVRLRFWTRRFVVLALLTALGASCSDSGSNDGAAGTGPAASDGGPTGEVSDGGADAGNGGAPDSGETDGGALDSGKTDWGAGDGGADADDGGAADSGEPDGGAGDGGDGGEANGRPHLPSAVTHVVGRQEQEVSFSLEPADPEGDPFSIYFKGCAHDLGVVSFCKDAACSETVVLDCSIAYDEHNVGQVLEVDPALQGRFTAGSFDFIEQGDAYNTVYLAFDDGNSEPVDTAVVFDVRVDNTPPVLTIGEEDRATYELTLLAGQGFQPGLAVHDAEVIRSEAFLFAVEATIDDSSSLGVGFDLAYLNIACTSSFPPVLTSKHLEYACVYDGVAGFLASILVLPPTGPGQASIVVTVTDLGGEGQDPSLPGYSSERYPMTDMLTMDISWQ